MFKKFIIFFLSPLSMGFFLALLGVYFLIRAHYRRAKLFFTISIVWIFFISYQPLSNNLLALLERQYKRLETIPADVNCVLALGGDAVGRSYELLRLHAKDRELKIITSGHEPKGADGAFHTARLLEESGVPKDLIRIHALSRDTKEEVEMMKEVVGSKPFILVTAAYHMPRAMALFQKAGLHPIAAPTNFLVKRNHWLDILHTDDMDNLDKAVHEFWGLLWYKIRGDI